ncbi:hypothetical protein DXG01_006196 [Tephrocybe rancida]|nr:hypothetical protein DXG01_006196 [Tephrocybe rancida]
MSPLSKRSTHSGGKVPNITLSRNGKLLQAPKHSCKTGQSNEEDSNTAAQPAQLKKSTRQTCQSRDTDKDVNSDTELPAPTPAAPCPAPRKKSGPANAVAPGANAKDESFISACTRALKKNLLNCAAVDISNPPPRSQPPPILQPPPHHPSPEDAGLPPRSVSPDSNETPPPLPSQPRRDKTPPPPSLQPCCTPSPSDFEATRTAKQLAISWMHPEKCPVSQEEVDEEDDQEFKEDIQAQLNPKGKKGKGKTSKANGPFKSGPVPDQAKECAFAIHAESEKQIQDLAAEIGKAPQLLFSLVGEGPLPSCRAPNQWSAFEAWYGVNGEKKKSKDSMFTLFH